MIVVDTSAIVSIFAAEEDAAAMNACIADDAAPVISAGTMLEVSIVLRTLTPGARLIADDWMDRYFPSAGFRIEPVTEEHIAIAREAHRKYGKGMGHPAQLNFGDCFSYALAKALNVPLLYKGGDFEKTDVVSAL